MESAEEFIMKKLVNFVIGIVCLATFASVAGTANNANQTVSFSVIDINGLSVSGNPGLLIINTAAPGLEPDVSTDATTWYNFTTNSSSNKKITAQINGTMPTEVTLKVALAAPAGAASAGTVDLSAGAVVDVVTGLSKIKDSGLAITYTLSATHKADVVTSSKTVTFTLTQ